MISSLWATLSERWPLVPAGTASVAQTFLPWSLMLSVPGRSSEAEHHQQAPPSQHKPSRAVILGAAPDG